MKKFVIILLMCALAAGSAFAQDGSWSISGKGEIGTILNFRGDKTAKDSMQLEEDDVLLSDNAKLKLLVGANGFHNIDYYGLIGGDLFLAYQIGGLKAGLEFYNERAGSYLSGVLSYQDETRAFQYVQNLNSSGGLLAGTFAPERLWGYYKFLDGVIHLEAAYNSRDSQFFYTTGAYTPYDYGIVANLFAGGHTSSVQALRQYGLYTKTAEGNYFDSRFGRGFFKVDHHNYLLAQVNPVDGLSFGVMVPSIFVSRYNKESYYGGGTQNGDGQRQNNSASQGYLDGQNSNANVPFLDSALLHSRLGVKYGSGPITVSAQFAMLGRTVKNKVETWDTVDGTPGGTAITDGKGDKVSLKRVIPDGRKETLDGGTTYFEDPARTIATGLYLGAKYAISDSISAELGFQGEFYSKKPILGFGLGFAFNSGAFGAGLGAGLFTQIDPNEEIYWPQKNGSSTAFNTTTGTGVGAADKQFSGMYIHENPTGTEMYDKNDYVIKKDTSTLIGIQPTISYGIVANYLMFSLDANLYWRLGVNTGFNASDYSVYERKFQEDVFGYEITPTLWFNIAGTGAAKGYYSGNNNAIIVRYKVAGWIDGSEVRAAKKTWQSYVDVNDGRDLIFSKPLYNAVDITFKWTF